MKIETKDGQRKITVSGAKSLRVVASEEHIQKMSNGSLKAYRTRVLMYHKWINNLTRGSDQYYDCLCCKENVDFTYRDNKEVVDTVYWLQKAVNKEWYKRCTAASKAVSVVWARTGKLPSFSPRLWYKSEYAEAYKKN